MFVFIFRICKSTSYLRSIVSVAHLPFGRCVKWHQATKPQVALFNPTILMILCDHRHEKYPSGWLIVKRTYIMFFGHEPRHNGVNLPQSSVFAVFDLYLFEKTIPIVNEDMLTTFHLELDHRYMPNHADFMSEGLRC